ncbi:molybdenum cofactor guanylyltransferase [Pseudanabaena mucicola]|uniref:Probable molybdenum cofactor guanylyltransferase n=1 Tax=Pseudanabaena mucicola FACHB-723 TaxID=2692860 RepID=A0ABR8A211_9CYAN|nr:molybdenum cofactor guanylyltransferase [Pseudanabaena mucicola]MBD2189800.1 molybdenum cofactor guanylyltransferase [Pseudanabaena mucicola FACHB-723]
MKIITIVLSGGKSSRMGKDKALLTIDGETLLSRTCRIGLAISDQVIVVAKSQEQYDLAIAKNLENPQNIQLLIDQQFAGALIGFWQGLQAISNPPDWILLMACDLPNLQADILQSWAKNLAELPKTAIAVLPRYQDESAQKQWEPLCGFYRWQCRNSLTQFMESGGRSFQKWLSNQEVVEIGNVPLAMLNNCNTPSDFQAIQSPNQEASQEAHP